MKKLKYFNILFLFFLFSLLFEITNLYSQDINNKDSIINTKEINYNPTQQLQSKQKKRIYLAKTILSYGIDTNFCTENKIAAALNLALLVTNQYELVSPEEIDSAIAKQETKKYSAFDIAKTVNAETILVIKLEQLRNLLRAEISMINTSMPDSVNVSEGYAMLHYFTNDENKAIYDPTILAALQRAFAVSVSDTNLFSKQEILPSPLLVICGIEMIKEQNSQLWDIFNNELIKSYEITETIFEIISKSKNWITLDIDTRDFLYSLFKLYGVENNIAPTINELDALYKFGITHYITGTLKEISNELEITLNLNEIQEKNIIIKNKVVNKTKEKNTKQILEFIKILAKKLIDEKI